MKVTLCLKGDEERPVTTTDGAATAEAGGSCPKCHRTPFLIKGNGRRIESHDTYFSDAICVGCLERVGVIRAKASTIFGLEEDERVLYGRCRVY